MDKLTVEYIESWLKKAANDLQNVRNNFVAKEEDIPTDTVCFHCQQAGEKYLKGYLVFAGIKFPSTHSLADLVLLCSEKDSTFNEIMEKAESLTPFAVEIRYPDDFHAPTIEETKEVYEKAKEIRDFVLERIDIKKDTGK
ncbi:MAG: HEPN domain-containing protein [Spirochaetales bacterium]|nr:HEPN domain-containing protein [Spirochaetales bacterium]